MSCPLIGHIAVVPDPGMNRMDFDAIRVWRRNHDVILVKPPTLIWPAILDIMGLVSDDELPRLMWNVDCSCNDVVMLRTA